MRLAILKLKNGMVLAVNPMQVLLRGSHSVNANTKKETPHAYIVVDDAQQELAMSMKSAIDEVNRALADAPSEEAYWADVEGSIHDDNT